MSETVERLCGKCRFPIHRYDTVRHYGLYEAHLESRCIELLHAEVARLREEHATALAAERERALCDALAWAWYEIGDGDHRDKGGFDPGRDEFVAAGLIAIRAITPAPGAADTHTEGT